MEKLQKIYQKVSRQTQNKIQELIDTFNFSNENIYNITSIKDKQRINSYIEGWKDSNLLKGYFGMFANNIYRRGRVKNSEILELLIYSAYMEEQAKLEEQELQLFKEDVEYYYNEGINEVRRAKGKKKKWSAIPNILFLYLLAETNVLGYTWKKQVDQMTLNNVNQLYRQAVINLMQQKTLDIDSDEFKSILNNQLKQKVNINGDKISGVVDLELLGLNNMAKIKGIEAEDNNAKVVFLADIDGKETPMCHSLHRQEFYINKENEFDRYYGETSKKLRIQRIKCKGLVLGLNLPPINYHFHWCRSVVRYIPQIKNEGNIIFDSKGNVILNGIKVLSNKDLDKINKAALLKNLSRMEKVFKDFKVLKNVKIKYKVVKVNDNSAMTVIPTTKNGYILEINENVFNNKLKETYNLGLKKHDNPRGTTYKDIGIHEAGHMASFEIIRKVNKNNLKLMQFDYDNNVTTTYIVDKAFNNLQIYDNIQKEKTIKNISNYALKDSSETVAEAFIDYYCNKRNANILSKEIVKIMKGMI